MQTDDRLHALDAVRAAALLLGVALHAGQPFIAGLPWITTETPNDGIAGLWYTIHLFRMPLFFMLAGFFGRMMLERRGTGGFIKDRARRIALPLVVGVPIVMLITGAAYLLGGLAVGADPHSQRAPPSPPHSGVLASINLMHLWFLYYLVIFYAVALLAGAVRRSQIVVDTLVGFTVRSGCAPLLLAAPAIVYYSRLPGWSPWGGLPAPFSLIPDWGALIAYGAFFTSGWLLQRQPQLLATLERRWPLHGVLALGCWVACRALAGSTPHWGPFLHGLPLVAYAICYIAGAGYWSFALIGLALRYLAKFSPVRRYLADASYWIYLMHIAALLFFSQILHPLHLPSALDYLLSIVGALLVLLVSYHGLVRFTFVGAVLNGRRQPRGTPPRQVTYSRGC